MDGSDSWTHKLWRYAKDGLVTKVSINGPYGSGFNDISDRTQILGIGSGTGIVPMLSLLKSHMNSLLLWEPAMYLRARMPKQMQKIAILPKSTAKNLVTSRNRW